MMRWRGALVAAVLVAALMVRDTVRSRMQIVASCLSYPVLMMQHRLVEPIKRWQETRADMHALRQRVQELRDENQKLRAENAAFAATADYQQDIQALLEFKKRYEFSQGRIAQVIARELSDREHSFTLDVGSVHGVHKDMVALVDNHLVGKITQVYPWYSKLQLITDRQCKVAAYCSPSGARGIHEGANGVQQTLLRHVSHLEEVPLDTMIFSTGEGMVFPRGFLLGKVANIEKQELHHSIMLQPLCDFKTMRYCTVIAREQV